MATHASPRPRRNTLLRVGLTVSVAGAALGMGGAAAQAAAPPVPAAGVPTAALGDLGSSPVQKLTEAVTDSTAPATQLQLDPLANTGVDPLDNAVGTQIADFKPVSTAQVTSPVTKGASLKDLLAGG
ncbi:hypothetical protein AB0M87_10765 [Streptomyces sp. NPDC051320]|uniref:hypothetical protein n=1 Tax=Streptomyces sp. NPDC051320 TaxID=3154644 RepID=UPI0034302CFC